MLVQLQEANCIFINDFTFSMGFDSGLLPSHLIRVMAPPVAAMVSDVQDSDLWMRSVKCPPDGEFSSEADEILPAAA